MCQTGTGDASLNQVPLGESALLPVTVGTATQSSSPNAMMNNLIMPPATISPHNSEAASLHHISMKQTPVAVKNMILNAAADILSSEPNSISTENTINALMTLTTPSMTDVVHPEPQLTQVTTSNMALMTDHAAMQPQVNAEPMLMQSHNPFENQQTQSMSNMFTQSDATTAAAAVLNVVAAAVQSEAAMMNNYSMPSMNLNTQIMTMQTTSPTNAMCPPQTTFLNEFRYDHFIYLTRVRVVFHVLKIIFELQTKRTTTDTRQCPASSVSDS